MALGPGKYDDLCTYVRRQAKADGAVLIVLNGNRGHGFAVQADLMSTLMLPDLLETLARDIRASYTKGKI